MRVCSQCFFPLEPTDEAEQTGICGYCAGRIPKDRPACYDGAPCIREDGDCRNCEWLGGMTA